MSRRRWSQPSEEGRHQIARSNPSQLSMFGPSHTDELAQQAERRQEWRDYYARRYRVASNKL
jgi:hypothetical protein